jgi:D-inositol-3-phosphate glycosyltransferase
VKKKDRRLRVLMLESGGWGGIHQYVHALCDALSALPIDLALLTTQRYELEDRPQTFERMRVLRRENYVRTLYRLALILVRWRPDILHIQTFIAPRKDVLLVLLCRLCGVRIVHTVHNILPHEVRLFERQTYSFYYQMAAALILHSKANIEQLRQVKDDLDPRRLHIVPLGNYEHFRSLEMSREEARAQLGLPAAAQIALFAGMVRPYKGLDLLLDAVPAVRVACPEALFVVAGQVYEGREQYDEQIDRLGVGSEGLRVHFDYLSMEDLVAHVCAADLVVLPYREIYQSAVLIFAYSFGRAVVATRVGAFPECVEEGESGWLVEADDVGDLQRGLIEALSDPKCLAAAGIRARQLADEDYGWPAIAARTVRVYESAVEA